MRRLKGTLTGCSGSAGLCAYHLPVHRLCFVLSAPPDAGVMVAVPSFQMRRLRLRGSSVSQVHTVLEVGSIYPWPVCSKARAFALFPMMYQ